MDANQLVQRGFALLSRGQVEEAGRVAEDALARAPGAVPVRMLAGELAALRQNYSDALTHIEAAIAAEPTSGAHRFRKAEIQLMMRQGLEAQKTAAAIAVMAPQDAGAQRAAATILASSDNHEGAEPYLRRAAEIGVEDALFDFAQAQNHFMLGRMDAAEAAADAMLARGPNLGQGHLLRARMRKQTPERNHVAALEALRGQSLRPIDAVQVRFALAKELDDLGRHQEAFAVLKEGADLRRNALSYDSASELKNINDIIATFTPSAYGAIQPGAASSAPIFIVGLPRSGATLIERMINADSSVRSLGETNDFPQAMAGTINAFIAANAGAGLSPLSAALRVNYRAMGETYVRAAEGMVGAGQRFVDKTPHNALYAGLIHKALPKAAIIHVTREPMDACWAIYRSFFNQAYGYSYTLDELADYYIAHQRLMAHWSQLAPQAILQVSYERLVREPEAESRRIMDACGLRWSPDAVRIEARRGSSFNAHATPTRRPLDPSGIGAWRKYERELAPLREKLARAGLL